jgi:hypothetical protein
MFSFGEVTVDKGMTESSLLLCKVRLLEDQPGTNLESSQYAFHWASVQDKWWWGGVQWNAL